MEMLPKIIRFTFVFALIILIFHVNCGKTPAGPNLENITHPVIWLSVSEMSFTATKAGMNTFIQALQVKNSGIETLSYFISDNSDWLGVKPASGSSSDNVNEYTVSVDISGLDEGNYSGTITINDSNTLNNPQTVSVSLEIRGPLKDNEISISCDPNSGGIGTIVTIPVTIKGNMQEIGAFGLELTYDATMFEYQNTSAGNLTGSWTAVDGNEIRPGTVRVEGYAGYADYVLKGSAGSIVKITLKVSCIACNDGQQSQICIQNYKDDIVGMISAPSCVTFTYKK
jgi:hypothetical protein